MDAPNVVGIAGVPGQGRYLIVYLRLAAGRISQATFEAHGCGVTIACGSVLTGIVSECTPEECADLAPEHLIDALDGIPSDKRDCAGFALHALRDALKNLNLPEPASSHSATAASTHSDEMSADVAMEAPPQQSESALSRDLPVADHVGLTAKLPPCHSRRELPDDPTAVFCAHPQVHAPGQRVTPQICRLCHYWKQSAPAAFRSFDPRVASIRRFGFCRFLGPQTEWRQCPSCPSNVRIKVFACGHPDHDVTTLDECNSCPDFENVEGAALPSQ
jgi:nitrogen fixation NifU-like protein